MANKLNAETIIVTNGEDIKKVTRKAFNVIYKRLGYMEVPEDVEVSKDTEVSEDVEAPEKVEVPEDVEVSKDVKAKTSTRKNSTKKG
jgi:predicted acyltransferase (DUF342 family)